MTTGHNTLFLEHVVLVSQTFVSILDHSEFSYMGLSASYIIYHDRLLYISLRSLHDYEQRNNNRNYILMRLNSKNCTYQIYLKIKGCFHNMQRCEENN